MSSPTRHVPVLPALIAALSATGKSVIQNIEQMDRRYQFIDERLRSLGADIRRWSDMIIWKCEDVKKM